MERLGLVRSLCRSALRGSRRSPSTALRDCHLHRFRHGLRQSSTSRSLFHLAPASLAASAKPRTSDCRGHFALGIGTTRSFSDDMSHLPDIKDPEIASVFKDLMAASWDEIPDPVHHDAMAALTKNTVDKSGQEALANVFRAAEAAVEFGGILVTLRMEIDDSIGLSGENVKPLSEEFVNALHTVYQRYTAYLDAFGPEESYLRKKVETELGTKMIHLKMRCSGLGSEWGKVTVLGTSGLSGSYVEQRAS